MCKKNSNTINPTPCYDELQERNEKNIKNFNRPFYRGISENTNKKKNLLS